MIGDLYSPFIDDYCFDCPIKTSLYSGFSHDFGDFPPSVPGLQFQDFTNRFPVGIPHGLQEEPILFEHLTAEQQDAARRALRGENLFLTGAAGTGKLGRCFLARGSGHGELK